MTDLQCEMNAACDRIRQPHLDQLVGLGVSSVTIARLGAVQAPFGVVSATVSDHGLYVPGDGPLHLVQPVIHDGEIIDLVAWRSLQPSKWWLRSGLGWALGQDNWTHRNPWDADEPFPVHATPLDWLRAGGDGVCIVDWTAPEVRELRIAQSLLVGTAALGKALIATLSAPSRLPEIRAMEAADAA